MPAYHSSSTTTTTAAVLDDFNWLHYKATGPEQGLPRFATVGKFAIPRCTGPQSWSAAIKSDGRWCLLKSRWPLTCTGLSWLSRAVVPS